MGGGGGGVKSRAESSLKRSFITYCGGGFLNRVQKWQKEDPVSVNPFNIRDFAVS